MTEIFIGDNHDNTPRRGIRFYDMVNGRDCFYVVDEASVYDQSIAYKHPDGQWVFLRWATKKDLIAIRGICRSLEQWHYEQANFTESAMRHEDEQYLLSLIQPKEAT